MNSIFIKIFFGVISFLFLLFLTVNTEELFNEKGYNKILVNAHDWVSANNSILFILGIVLGVLLVLISVQVFPTLKVKIVYPNVPTSLRAQFKEGSEDVTQLSFHNINNSHFLRFNHNFHNDNNEIVLNLVFWFVFLTFDRPTQYGQIVVDAGNAKIPPYEILSSRNDSAIVFFKGDIGNLALEIRTR